MSKFELGDMVIVKSFDEIEAVSRREGSSLVSGRVSFVDSMMKFTGRTFEVVSVDHSDDSYILRTYTCDDDNRWWFDEKWLEPAMKPVVLPEELFEL